MPSKKLPSAHKRSPHDDLPASVGLVKAVRDELRSEIRAVSIELKTELKVEIGAVRGEIGGVKSEMHHLQGEVHQMRVLMEEQRGEDRIVMDGLKMLFDRQSRIEEDFKVLARSRPTV